MFPSLRQDAGGGSIAGVWSRQNFARYRSRMPVIRVVDAADARLGDYVGLTDVALRSRHEPAKGLYIAESSSVIHRALAAGHRPRSFLMAEKWLPDMADALESSGAGDGGDIPVFVADEALLRDITGFHLHRGALAAMHRPPLATVSHLLAHARSGEPARRIVILEDIVDHTNVGAIFRSVAGLGADAVLITPRCADPLYRRSVRVSMGTVFQVPWTRLVAWPDDLDLLRAAGFTIAALALTADAVALDDFASAPPERVALLLGTEGDGLSAGAITAADVCVRIPMQGGVDSLNVAAASAVAVWALR
jgi:tRNA G18 (ribose-2'-O)-methylase SpoU